MHEGAFRPANKSMSSNVMSLTHADHWKRGNFGIDNYLPVCRLVFDGEPPETTGNYSQILNIYEGKLETRYNTARGNINLTARFKHGGDVLSVRYKYDGSPENLALLPMAKCDGGYGEKYEIKCVPQADGFLMDTGNTVTRVIVRVLSEKGSCETIQDERMRLKFSPGGGDYLILIGIASESRTKELADEMDAFAGADEYERGCEASWAKRYGDAYVALPDGYLASMYARSLYILMSSFAPGFPSPAPMGWTGLGWKFHFPQDISYIHPVFLKLGQFDIAKSIVETYRNSLDDMCKITSRVYGGEGAMWAWSYPIGKGDDLFKEGFPNYYQFEIHNAAYPARMAYETAVYTGDEQWRREVALPVIEQSARFYASHMHREQNGHWGIKVVPSMSQDEKAKPNGKNYLCALYAARYVFSIAVRCGLKMYEHFLRDTLAFDWLYDKERGLYRTYEEMTPERWGLEKHPVQLLPMTYLPAKTLDDAERMAYKQRAEICANTKSNVYSGWTLGSFWLASAYAGDGDTLLEELLRADDDTYSDKERIAFYESTGGYDGPYFTTSHGIFLHSILKLFAPDEGSERHLPEVWKNAEYCELKTADVRI